MTNLLIHHATSVSASRSIGRSQGAITLTVETDGFYGRQPVEITIYDLPTHVADALEELLGKGGVKEPAPQP
jgi:hypothetical protein